MADELNVEFDDGEDESIEELISRIKDQVNRPEGAPRSGSQPEGVDQTASRSTPLFNPFAQQDNTRKLVAQEQAKRERERREQIKEDRRRLAQQSQDERRELRQEIKESKSQSQQEVTGARSDAISQRVGAYGLSAALGFPGYIGASFIDSKFIRPNEEERVNAEKQYQKELEEYRQRREKAEIDARRRAEENIRNRPIDATPIDGQGKPIPQTGGAGGGPPQFPGGPTYPMSGEPPKPEPPILPPTRPSILDNSKFESFSKGAGALTAGLIIGREVNQAVDSIFQNLSRATDGLVSGDAIQGSKGLLSTAQNVLDPIGTNVGLNVAVEGFDLLLDLNKGILDSIKGTEAFAPQTLVASIEGELVKLERQITNAQKLDNLTAEIVRINTQIDSAWDELRVEFLQTMGPLIVANLKAISIGIKTITAIIQVLSEMVSVGAISLGDILSLVGAISNYMEENKLKELDESSILAQIDRFFDPVNKQPRPGGMPLS